MRSHPAHASSPTRRLPTQPWRRACVVLVLAGVAARFSAVHAAAVGASAAAPPSPSPPPPLPTRTAPIALAPALLTAGRLVVPDRALPASTPSPPFTVSLCGGRDSYAVYSRLPRAACLVEVSAVDARGFDAAVGAAAASGSLRRVPVPALAAGLYNWPHYGHALGNSLFGLWGTLVEAGLAGDGGASAGRGRGGRAPAGRGRHGPAAGAAHTTTAAASTPLPIYVRACGQGQEYVDAATGADGVVDLAASTPLAPAFHALAAPGRATVFLSWAAAVHASTAEPLLFTHLTVGLSQSADQYNHTLDGRLLRGLAARVAEAVGAEDGGGGGGGGGDGGGGSHPGATHPSATIASSRLAGLLARHRAAAARRAWSSRRAPPPTVLIIHRNASRVIENEAALVAALDGWARARGGHAAPIAFETLSFADAVAAVRRPAWTALVGVDGTGLLNALWTRPGCGVAVRLATWGTSAVQPNKGVNMDRVARATAGQAAVWECGGRACARPEGADAARLEAKVMHRNGSVVAGAAARDRFLWVTRQGVSVDVDAVVGMVAEAWEKGGGGGGCGA